MRGERERMRGNGRGCNGTAKGPLVPVGIPTGSKGSLRHRVIYTVAKSYTFGLTLLAPVGEPGLKSVFNRYILNLLDPVKSCLIFFNIELSWH